MATIETQRSEQILVAIEALASSRTVDETVEVLRRCARRLVGADGVAVILREGDECSYVEEDAVGPLWKGQRFPMSACVSGWAMLHRRPAIIPDITADERVPFELYRDTFVRSMAMVPVRTDDPIGAIGAYWSEPYDIPDDTVALLERLARAAAAAIDNARLVAALSRALGEAELARDELRHRVKNAYAATHSLAALTLPAGQACTLGTRIAALARAHELLDHQLARKRSIGLDELVAAELEPYAIDAGDRMHCTGDPISLASSDAIAIGLVLNELATNSLKYGALSTPRGRLTVAWSLEGDHVALQWRECGGPRVQSMGIENFGSRLLRRLIEGQLHGTIQRELTGRGVTCRIEFCRQVRVPGEPLAA